MQKLLLKLVLFLLPIPVVIGIAEHRLGQVRNSYTVKRDLVQIATNCEVLVLGSSHALLGVNPAAFSRPSLNMANNSQLLYHDTQILHRFAPGLPKLKVVIFPISYFSLESDPGIGPESWRTFLYRQYYGIPANRWQARLDLKNYSKLALYGHRAFHYLLFLPDDLVGFISDTGWLPRDTDPIRAAGIINDQTGQARVRFHHELMREEYRTENIRYLRDGIEYCLRHGITPVLLTLPVYRTYADHVNEKKLAWQQAYLRNLATEYRLTYRDYLTDSRFSEADFSDNDHLSRQGAEKFSRIIDDEILRPVAPTEAPQLGL